MDDAAISLETAHGNIIAREELGGNILPLATDFENAARILQTPG